MASSLRTERSEQASPPTLRWTFPPVSPGAVRPPLLHLALYPSTQLQPASQPFSYASVREQSYDIARIII